MKRLWILCLLSVAATPIYSPKYAEHVKSLQKVRTVRTLIVPKVLVPPATNQFYIVLRWTNNCNVSVWNVAWGTTSTIYTRTQQVTSNYGTYPAWAPGPGLNWTNLIATNESWAVISNLVPRTKYYFSKQDCSLAKSEYIFPPIQPPITNTAVIGCPGPLQIKTGSLYSGTWTLTTNRVFLFDQKQNYFWKGTNGARVSITITNNQVLYNTFRQ